MSINDTNRKNALVSSLWSSRPKLRSFLRGFGFFDDDTDDILQDVGLKALETIDRQSVAIDNLSSWLFVTTRNVALKLLSKNKPSAFSETFADGYFPEPAADTTPESEEFRRIMAEELAKAVSELPEEQREAFELTEIEGLSVKEVSVITGAPIATILSRKHYAVKKLRNRLEPMYQLLNE